MFEQRNGDLFRVKHDNVLAGDARINYVACWTIARQRRYCQCDIQAHEARTVRL